MLLLLRVCLLGMDHQNGSAAMLIHFILFVDDFLSHEALILHLIYVLLLFHTVGEGRLHFELIVKLIFVLSPYDHAITC